ncbi:RNA polymerase sigma factor [Cohnella endophytica]|uniref:RNA polymerase sigma factor n=1 Tax=Cohnella endophytica TaxID=2419778 RepID=A0A494XH48_9BACL|nr:RNA polymerase sigma factor [Cohnella endophytica]RKP47936.1 RNA polymerase sigma factor [Cohnella endophytica]
MAVEWRMDENGRRFALVADEQEESERPRPRMTERELIEQARDGNREAFGELVRQHRAEALGVANRMVRDAHMAEDVVQDALVRAFLHLGSLMDSSKFVPWFHRIVRNQAYQKLRRGGPHAKEQPFSAIGKNGGGATAGAEYSLNSDNEETDWTNVDRILFRLQTAAALEARNRGDPAECLMRTDMLRGLRELLAVLSKRERGIFEAHFFGELPPSEIAELLGTTTANIYNSLSRSRAKVRKERIRISIGLYVQKRAEQGLPNRKVLSTPP